jgi:hypothetical protein
MELRFEVLGRNCVFRGEEGNDKREDDALAFLAENDPNLSEGEETG